MDAVTKFLLPHIVSQMPPEFTEDLGSPALRLISMMSKVAPDFLDDMASADMNAIVIVLAELLFQPGELAQILEGRAAERAIKA